MTSTTMELADAYGNQRMTDGHHDIAEDHPHTLKARAELHQRIKELERDALRYRWIAKGCEEELAVKIDRAMSEAALTKAVEISQEYKLP